ncbi:MAG: radical SAM protein [Candidatus Omnitrophica bacterium]|nr:radical SAM protein [Candidatus Omnitrophota bacterium]MCM8830677.1 radical SAM protein [Candidatus Omnitrophota bacterium]
MKYFYGPVPSRRLGLSLGVDIVRKKTCPFDCIYCQLGRTTHKTIERKDFVDFKKFKLELKEIIKKNPSIDYITISGSGEPTLNKNLGKIIRTIKKITKNKYPVCVITNSSLLHLKKVREGLKLADLIIPSLDAADAKTFYKIDKPLAGVKFKKIIEGLINLRKEFKGKIWLEIVLVGSINDTVVQAKKFKKLIEKIKPDKVQLNIPIRPSITKIKLPSKEKIYQFKKIIGKNVEIIFNYKGKKQKNISKNIEFQILNYLKRRPATLKDLKVCLNIDFITLKKYLKKLLNKKIYKKDQYFIFKYD